MVIFVVVDGIIGAGKSTVLALLKEKGYTVNQQPVDEWMNMLTKFYKDQKKYAYELQVVVINSYISILKKYENDFSNKIVFLESYVVASFMTFGQMLLKSGMLDEGQMILLHKLLPKVNISLYIYINVTVEVALERIKNRDRSCESTIKLDYLQSLSIAYAEFMKCYENKLIIKVFDNDKNMECSNIVSHIENIISKDNRFDIAIEGNIGSGKTTFGEFIEKDSSFKFINQIITNEIAHLLKKRYKHRKCVFELQEEFIKMYSNEMIKCSNSKINGWEGVISLIHIFSKIAYENGEISLLEFETLKSKYKQYGLPLLEDFKLILLFNPSPKELMHRISQRNRDGEEKITSEYISKIKDAYMNVLSKLDNVLIIDNTHMSNEEIKKLIYSKFQEVYFNKNF